MADLSSFLFGRIDEAFERYDSYFPIVNHVVYLPLEGILRDAAPRLSCRKGCHSCCGRIITATRIEALALVDYIYAFTTYDTTAIKAQVRDHARMLKDFLDAAESENNDHIWFEKKIFCPFLKNGECGVYAARPLSCRLFHSTDGIEKCETPIRSAGQLAMLGEAEALFQVLFYKTVARVDSALAVKGVLPIIIDDIVESEGFKKDNP